jgi:hypothetical protein
MPGRSRVGLLIAVGVGIVLAVAVVLRSVNARRSTKGPDAAHVATAPPGPRDPTKPQRTPVWLGEFDDDDGNPSEDQQYKADPLNPNVDTAEAWAQVDFDEIRQALPESMYWKMAFPTKDPELIAERERIRAAWNAQFGKIQANIATDEEIDAYYAEQAKLSNDYLEFLVYLADHYGNVVPRAEIGALKLAGEMHLAKLEELPRRIAEAKERHAAHEAARQAWREEQQRFATPAAPQ